VNKTSGGDEMSKLEEYRKEAADPTFLNLAGDSATIRRPFLT
jgi:hypothetical protein